MGSLLDVGCGLDVNYFENVLAEGGKSQTVDQLYMHWVVFDLE